jgi:hypothetical protein
MSPSSRLSATSTGAPSRNGVRVLGEGDKITEGTLRWRSGSCPRFKCSGKGSSAGAPVQVLGSPTLVAGSLIPIVPRLNH